MSIELVMPARPGSIPVFLTILHSERSCSWIVESSLLPLRPKEEACDNQAQASNLGLRASVSERAGELQFDSSTTGNATSYSFYLHSYDDKRADVKVRRRE